MFSKRDVRQWNLGNIQMSKEERKDQRYIIGYWYKEKARLEDK
jgi:hypothetical protein